MIEIVKSAAVIFALDVPWLYAVSGWAGSVIRGIQGSPLEAKVLPGAVVYLALGFLLGFAKSVQQAFGLGLATYAVYDFTNHATLKKYPLAFAVADSLWGGTLMAAAWWVRNRVWK